MLLNPPKLLFANPLGHRADAAQRGLPRVAHLMPPFGLACFAHPDSIRDIAPNLRSKRPGFIGPSRTTSSFLDGIRIAKGTIPGVHSAFRVAPVSASMEASPT